jgi:hypothetical protein
MNYLGRHMKMIPFINWKRRLYEAMVPKVQGWELGEWLLRDR